MGEVIKPTPDEGDVQASDEELRGKAVLGPPRSSQPAPEDATISAPEDTAMRAVRAVKVRPGTQVAVGDKLYEAGETFSVGPELLEAARSWLRNGYVEEVKNTRRGRRRS